MNDSTLPWDFYVESAVQTSDVTINVVCTGLLVVIGLFGNVYCITQLRRTNLRRFALSSYLLALAVSDSCFLVSLTLLFFYNLGFTILSYPVLCQLTYYVSYQSCFLSGWYIVGLSIERCIAVYSPLRQYISNTHQRSLIVICGITVLGMILNSWPLFVFERHVNHIIFNNTTLSISTCDISDSAQNYYKLLSYFDATISCFVPVTLMIVFNLLIIRKLYTAQHIRNTLTNDSNNMIKMSSTSRKFLKKRSVLFAKMRSRERKVAVLLLAIPIAHILLNGPNYFSTLITIFNPNEKETVSPDSNEKEPPSTNSTLEIVFQFIFYSQYSINFILYSCRNQMIFCKKNVSTFSK